LQDGGKALWRYIGVLYAALPVLALVVLRNDQHFGLLAIIFLMLIVWAADIFAYFAGRIIGGPKLAPRLSPKKTWAGLFGAVAGAMALAFLVSRSGLDVAQQLKPLPLMVLAGVLAIVEQAGDIFESAFKRHYGVKDSGTLIPGHGGVMDRLDGLIFVAVTALLIGLVRAGSMSTAQGLLVW
jgi:phosphatidate cytidylyltransferase